MSMDALRHFERLLAKDPVLRDVVERALPSIPRAGKYSPDVEVLEAGSTYRVVLDVPGVPRDALTVAVEGRRLVVEGSRALRRPKGATVRMSERGSGPFKRTFLLPPEVDADDVKARLSEGVLTITLPRRGDRGTFHVNVEDGGQDPVDA